MKWQIRTAGQCYECGEDMVVFFDPASGDTHLVSGFAHYLMNRLEDAARPLDLEDIIALATDDIEPEDLDTLSQAIPEILDELADLNIVTPA